MFILPESIKTMLNALMAVFAKKEDIPKELPDEDLLAWLNEENIVAPVASVSGELYTTNNNEIYVL